MKSFAISKKGRTFALAFRKGGTKKLIFDRLRTFIEDKQRGVHYIL